MNKQRHHIFQIIKENIEMKILSSTHLNWAMFPYTSLLEPSKDTSSALWWLTRAVGPAYLAIGFLIYGGSYFSLVVFLLL